MSSLRHLIETICQLMNEFSQPVGEFTTSNLEMLLWLWWQHTYWQQCQTYPSSKQTPAEVLTRSPVFLALLIHSLCLPFSLIILIYHRIGPLTSRLLIDFSLSMT
jgi:hypothetical protein